jgi:SAM-dependent methyltransferase
VPSVARYDAHADWFEQWTGDSAGLIAEHDELLPDVRATRVLDAACGLGRNTRFLAGLGATVVGVDVSAELLARARARSGVGTTYVHGDITDPAAWWDGQPFDGCTCEMAFMDIDDLTGTLAAVALVVRPGGWFVASIVHPCFPGNARGLSSWPPDLGYGAEGWWTSPDHDPEGVRIRVGSTHRTVATYVNGLLDAGFDLERIVEPCEPVPTYLLWRCRRR